MVVLWGPTGVLETETVAETVKLITETLADHIV